MNMKNVFACVVSTSLLCGNVASAGMIYLTDTMKPSSLNTPASKPGKNYRYTYIGCVNAANGEFTSCGYDMSITGLVQPESDIANNGGHTHSNASPEHPVGNIKVIWPGTGSPTKFISGSTNGNYVYVSHEMPEVSGKIETRLNVRVPFGWHTVYPVSCDSTNTSWCFDTKIDVGLNLSRMPDDPALYQKVRTDSVDHTNDVAFYGTDSSINKLIKIADWYNWLSDLQYQADSSLKCNFE